MQCAGPPALLPSSVETWRCAPLNTGKPPPIAMIVYLLGSFGYLGDHAYRHMFGYTTESEIGTLYLVVDQGTELYQLSDLIGTVNRSGDVGARSCDRLHTTGIRRVPVKSSHYSTCHAMTKLDVLEHLPRDLPAVALLDTDTFCIADCASRLQAQHRAMVRASDTAFVAATRNPPLKSSQNGHTAGTLRDGRDGINSGVLVLDLERMRAFATRYCPHRPWWMCVIDDKNESSYDWHGDQWIWIHLLQRKQGLWYELPCGLHAEVDVLRGAAIELIVGATSVGEHNVHALCDPHPESWGQPKASGPKLDGDVGKYRRLGMPSAFFCPRSADDIGRGRIGPVDPVAPDDYPRLASGVSALPAITHGAGRCLPLARRVAEHVYALLRRQPLPEAARRVPCTCLHMLRPAKHEQEIAACAKLSASPPLHHAEAPSVPEATGDKRLSPLAFSASPPLHHAEAPSVPETTGDKRLTPLAFWPCPKNRSYGMRAPAWQPTAADRAGTNRCLSLRKRAGLPDLQLTVARVRVEAREACFRMAILLRQDVVSWSIIHLGRWELNAASEYASWPGLPKGAMLPSSRHSTFLDIGQNLGFHSFLFAQAGFHVIGIEAMAQNRHATEATLCLNPSWLPHVRTIPVALASPTMNGSSCLAVSSGVNAGNGQIVCGGTPETCESYSRRTKEALHYCEHVMTRTLDDVLQSLRTERPSLTIDVVKMDVEGFECEVLDGGQALFARFKPRFIMVETKDEKVGACVRMQARLHGYTVSLPKGQDKNVVLYTTKT